LVMDFIGQANNIGTLEHSRILNEVRQQQVAIPPEMTLLPVVSINGKAVQLRNLVYSPTRVIGMKMYWHENMGSDNTMFDEVEGWDNARDDAFFECVGKSKYSMAMMTAKVGTNVITSRQIYHSMGVYAQNQIIKWHDMCIGNATAEQYWGVPFNDYVRNINTINLDSLGKHDIYFGDAYLSIRDYVQELTYKVFTAKTRGQTWTA